MFFYFETDIQHNEVWAVGRHNPSAFQKRVGSMSKQIQQKMRSVQHERNLGYKLR